MSDRNVQIQEREVERRAENLVRTMRSLGQRLVRLADTVEREPLTALVNALGEIQSEGSSIDAGCGGYNAAKEALKLMRAGDTE